jgi:hypothetical protein
MNPDLTSNFESSVALTEVPLEAYKEESEAIVHQAIERLALDLDWSGRRRQGHSERLSHPAHEFSLSPISYYTTIRVPVEWSRCLRTSRLSEPL